MNDEKLIFLNKFNDLKLKLEENINDKNYYEIIIILQKDKFDSNNLGISEISEEKDEFKNQELIENLDSRDFESSGYSAHLFSIFNDNTLFYLKENSVTHYI